MPDDRSQTAPQSLAAGACADGGVSAALFDFDGTLVDTMPIHYEAYRQVLAEVGVALSRDDFFGNIGGNARETIPKFLRGRRCPIAPAEIHARKKVLVKRLLSEQPIVVLETAKLLPVFAATVPVALVSSGSRPGIEIVLARLHWERYFQLVITGEDAPRGKPEPDLFLLAATRLGVEPAGCIVFEDTDDGIEAATRAGMRAFDVRATRAPSSREFPS